MEYSPLHSLCESITDCPHSTPEWTTSGKVVIRNQNIKNGKLDLSSPSYTTTHDFQCRIIRAKPASGDIIITREAPMGEACLVPEGLECCLGQRMVLLKPDDKKCNNKYLLYAILSPYVQHQISWSFGTGTTVSNLRIPHLEALKIPCPDRSVQDSIAATLSSLDDKIELNNRIIANLETQAQAIFDEWFMAVDIDFPVGVLSDIAEVNPTRTLSKGQLATYIEMSSLSTSNSFPNNWVENTAFNGGMKFQNGDTVIARITPCLENGKTAYITCLEDGEVGFGSTEYIVLSAKPGYCNEMLYFLARNEDFRNYAIQNMNGSSGRQRVSGETIGNYEMAVPTIEASKQFEAVAKPIMGTIHNCAMQNRKLAQTRDALLPKLMSGEVEVPVEG